VHAAVVFFSRSRHQEGQNRDCGRKRSRNSTTRHLSYQDPECHRVRRQASKGYVEE